MISRKAKYTLRALLELAREWPRGKALMASRISAEQHIPRKFLEQILLELKQNGILDSRRGKTGGYLLIRAPETITFGEILRLVDGPVAPLPCLSRIAYERCVDCGKESECEVRRVFSRVAEATRAVLDRTSLADAIVKLESDTQIAESMALESIV